MHLAINMEEVMINGINNYTDILIKFLMELKMFEYNIPYNMRADAGYISYPHDVKVSQLS